MTSHCDAELAALAREIAAKQLSVGTHTVLIGVLERDGLAKERSDVAIQIARQFQLLETRCTSR